MKKLLIIIVLLANLCLVYSQDYDLIVKSNGDSIACHIDSITDTHIYFEMKINKYWKHTHINKADVIELQRNVINKKTVVFKPGTSYIESPRQELAESIRDIQKNSVYLSLSSVNYSIMIPGDRVGFTVAGGFNFILGVQAETTVLIGRTKHFYEPGIMVYYGFLEVYDEPVGGLIMIRTGYRYQGPKGFLFRVSPMLAIDIDDLVFLPWPTASIGYSF
jgi:hypothetical protein